MSNWPGKYVIGLTGNIATGKSVVRRMLEHLGAYSIDADALSHRAITRGAPGYQPVIDAFGKWILDAGGEIDRTKLGKLVFTDPEALKQLENIVHPLVRQALDLIIKRAAQRVIVIEAIKLLEGNLAATCDSIWVTTTTEEFQLKRLMEKRNMSRTDALQRIHAQGKPEQKTAMANVIIENSGSFGDTWNQVAAAWKKISPASDTIPVVLKKAAAGELSVERGRPRDSAQIASLINRLSKGAQQNNPDDIMALFGEKAFLLLKSNDQIMGLIGWQVENLVSRATDVYIDPSVAQEDALRILVTEVENASSDLQCEASLLFLPSQLAGKEDLWTELGYERRSPQALGAQAWQDAARESMPGNTVLFFKQLRQDRVLRPI